MIKFKKVLNLKVFLLFIAIIFSFENAGYAISDICNLRVPLDTKRVAEALQWSVTEVSRREEPPVLTLITNSDKLWVKESSLDLESLPAGTLVYLGDTGQSIGGDVGEGYPIRYLIKVEESGIIKLWFGNNRGCYIGPAELLGSILYIKGRPQFIPGKIQARADIDFPYFKWESGIGLLPLINRKPNELTWPQRFPFFRVLYNKADAIPHNHILDMNI